MDRCFNDSLFFAGKAQIAQGEADEVAAMCSNAPQHFARIAQELNPAVRREVQLQRAGVAAHLPGHHMSGLGRFVFLSTDQVLDGKGALRV